MKKTSFDVQKVQLQRFSPQLSPQQSGSRSSVAMT